MRTLLVGWFLIACIVFVHAQEVTVFYEDDEGKKTLQGKLTNYESGELILDKNRIPLEQVQLIKFSDKKPISQSGTEVALRDGSIIFADSVEFSDHKLTIKSTLGDLIINREDLDVLKFGALSGSLPELDPEKKIDKLLIESDKKIDVHYSELEYIKDGKVKLKDVQSPFDLKSVKLIFFYNTATNPISGWFSQITLTTGDQLIAMLLSIKDEGIVVFSDILGEKLIRKSQINYIKFTEFNRLISSNFAVISHNSLKEFDRFGRTIFQITQLAYCIAAARTKDGGYLVSDYARSEIKKYDPKGRINWRRPRIYAGDVTELENGNILVCYYPERRVAEYDKEWNEVWSYAPSDVHSTTDRFRTQRLRNGDTLIQFNDVIIRVDSSGKRLWKMDLKAGVIYARGLEDENILITNQSNGSVSIIDKEGKEIWKITGLQTPNDAIRSKNGNILIIESGKSRIIEVDQDKKIKVLLENIGQFNRFVND